MLGLLWFLAGIAALAGVIRMASFTLPAIHEEVKVIRKRIYRLEERANNGNRSLEL